MRKRFQLRKAFMNPADIFSEVGKILIIIYKILSVNKTLKKMFENEVHCFITTQCFQLLNCIESYRIASNRTESFFINMHLFLYRIVPMYRDTNRIVFERFTPLVYSVSVSALPQTLRVIYPEATHFSD